MKRLLSTLTLTLGAGAALAFVGAGAASADVQQSSSANWAGYVASGTTFSDVSGSWTQPSVTCGSSDTYSAYWVGIGGSGNSSSSSGIPGYPSDGSGTGSGGSGSTSLEQMGTQANCSNGSPQYYAWYELLPAAPVNIDVPIKPGDKITAKVTVSGNETTFYLLDTTTGQSSKQTLQSPNPDTSSAEWVAEAPSTCDQTGNCQPLPLADFGTVGFSSSTATAGGHTGPISDPNWTATAVQLSAANNPQFTAYGGTDGGGSGAQTSSLSPDGQSFSVAWQSNGSSTSGATGGNGNGAGSGYPGSSSGSGYPAGSGYPGSSDPGSGSGSGYPGSGSGYGYPGAGSGYGYPGYGSGGYGDGWIVVYGY
jgi:hypothetical protein